MTRPRRRRYTDPRGLLEHLGALVAVPSYRLRVELGLVHYLAAESGNLEIEALCFDLDRLCMREKSDELGAALKAFVRVWFLILHADAAMRREDVAGARRWIEAAVIAAGDSDAVARAALARLAV